jgi:phage/plasmid-associated DNA primase
VKIDSGVYLRRHISGELRSIYSKKASYYLDLRSRLREGEDAHRIKQMTAHIDKIMRIFTRLGNSNDKKNIMTEAKELFFNDQFVKSLDANPNLICFNNGVVDFKTKVFRRGHPEDCLTKCTGIDYIPDVYGQPKFQSTIADIRDFMEKLFPDVELNKYMWEHLCYEKNQTEGVAPNKLYASNSICCIHCN